MKKTQRRRPMFTASNPAVFETLASVILGYKVNTSTPSKNAMPKEIKDLLKNL